MTKRIFFGLAFAACSLAAVRAARIDIPAGGYAIEAGEHARTTLKSGDKHPPQNVIFPRVIAEDFFLDSVIWTAAGRDAVLRTLLAAHRAPKGFSVAGVRDFRAAAGVEALRFTLRPTDSGGMPLARLLFRNRRGEVICVGLWPDRGDIADRVFRSLTLLE